jgi:hypothetical protein
MKRSRRSPPLANGTTRRDASSRASAFGGSVGAWDAASVRVRREEARLLARVEGAWGSAPASNRPAGIVFCRQGRLAAFPGGPADDF